MSSLKNNITRQQIFIRDNIFATAEYTNPSSDDAVTLTKGTVIGRISASGKILPLANAAADGSNDPLGILADDYAVAASGSVTVTYCFAGHVDESLVTLPSSQTLETVVSGKGRIRDLITRNTHITLVKGKELTKLDN